MPFETYDRNYVSVVNEKLNAKSTNNLKNVIWQITYLNSYHTLFKKLKIFAVDVKYTKESIIRQISFLTSWPTPKTDYITLKSIDRAGLVTMSKVLFWLSIHFFVSVEPKTNNDFLKNVHWKVRIQICNSPYEALQMNYKWRVSFFIHYHWNKSPCFIVR